MNRNVKKFGALAGVASLAALAAGPAMGATHVSQASAQALTLSIAGNTAVSQTVTATNDGDGEQKNNASTLPTIASLVPGNSLIGAGVAPQDAGAIVDKDGNGVSYACAGLAGTGGGVVKVGDSGCELNGKPLTIDLASLQLGDVLIGDDSVLGTVINQIPGIGPVLAQITGGLNGLITQISGALASTPLGEIKLGGSLSAIEASCTANPEGATGDARIVDSSGGSANTPIGVTLPGGTDLTLVNLPANPEPNTHVLVNLDKVTASLIAALKQQLNTMLGGALQPLAGALGPLLDQVQTQVLEVLVKNLQPLLQPLQQNVLDITLNKQVPGDDGKSIDVTALDLQVLPAAQQFVGSSLISGQIGHVHCGPNSRVAAPDEPTEEKTPDEPNKPTDKPDIPKHVDSGLAGYDEGGFDGGALIAATAALLALAGGAGTLAYRRYWMPRG